MDSTSVTKDQKLSETTTRGNLSPVRIYQFGPSANDTCRGARKCVRSHLLSYHGPRACKFRLVCSKLEGDPCGDYGRSVLMVAFRLINCLTLCACWFPPPQGSTCAWPRRRRTSAIRVCCIEAGSVQADPSLSSSGLRAGPRRQTLPATPGARGPAQCQGGNRSLRTGSGRTS